MRIKEGYILREVASHTIVVPTGTEVVNFNGVITLNKSGKLLWEELSKGASQEELVAKLLDVYDIDKQTATADVADFINVLKGNEILEI